NPVPGLQSTLIGCHVCSAISSTLGHGNTERVHTHPCVDECVLILRVTLSIPSPCCWCRCCRSLASWPPGRHGRCGRSSRPCPWWCALPIGRSADRSSQTTRPRRRAYAQSTP